MNNSLVLGIGALIVLSLFVYVAFFGFSKKTDTPVVSQVATTTDMTATSTDSLATTTSATSTGTTPSSATVSTGTTKPVERVSLIKTTTAHECLFEQSSPSSKTTGKVHVYNGKLRGEFRTSVGADINTQLVVYDGRYLYMWDEGKTTGVKSEPSTLADFPKLLPKDLTSGAIFNKGSSAVGYDCHSWAPVLSMLTPPRYVTFR